MYNRNQKGLLILLVYRPPTGDINYLCEKLKDEVQSLPENDEMILLGDFNVDYLNKKKQATSKLYKLEKDLLLSQTIQESTRVSHSFASCIDLISQTSFSIKKKAPK